MKLRGKRACFDLSVQKTMEIIQIIKSLMSNDERVITLKSYLSCLQCQNLFDNISSREGASRLRHPRRPRHRRLILSS